MAGERCYGFEQPFWALWLRHRAHGIRFLCPWYWPRMQGYSAYLEGPVTRQVMILGRASRKTKNNRSIWAVFKSLKGCPAWDKQDPPCYPRWGGKGEKLALLQSRACEMLEASVMGTMFMKSVSCHHRACGTQAKLLLWGLKLKKCLHECLS